MAVTGGRTGLTPGIRRVIADKMVMTFVSGAGSNGVMKSPKRPLKMDGQESRLPTC